MNNINMLFVLLGALLAFFTPNTNAATFDVESEIKDNVCYTKEYNALPVGQSYTTSDCMKMTCTKDGISGMSCPFEAAPDFKPGSNCHLAKGAGDYPDCCERLVCEEGKKL
ncbi:unnamed protein product [Larinioides sclopetarius]|uniref:Single domain-containing protein n=1 Tax=Larinioides sclopetarius TaxID=280406 RepID=A0AAV2BEJ1_9ARAC